MNQLSDFKIGDTAIVSDRNIDITHCLTVGAKVKIIGQEDEHLRVYQADWKPKTGRGEKLELGIEQWIHPADLDIIVEPAKPKSKWPHKKLLLREDKSLYLTRYTLLRTPWFRLRLHHIHLSDFDCLHDHPWNFLSIILWGGYTEVRQLPRKNWEQETVNYSWKNIRPGSILYRKAEDRHRLEISEGKSAWTLVFMFKRRREWGFWHKGQFIHNEIYKSTQNCDE